MITLIKPPNRGASFESAATQRVEMSPNRGNGASRPAVHKGLPVINGLAITSLHLECGRSIRRLFSGYVQGKLTEFPIHRHVALVKRRECIILMFHKDTGKVKRKTLIFQLVKILTKFDLLSSATDRRKTWSLLLQVHMLDVRLQKESALLHLLVQR